MTTPPAPSLVGKVLPPLRKLPRPGVCLAGLILLLIGRIEARGQEQPPPFPEIAVSGAGVELWSAVLHLHGLQLWQEEAKVPWSEAVVIHLGRDLRSLVREGDPRREEFLAVLRGGGGVLIATDGELDLPELGLRFQRGSVQCNDGRMIHRNRPSCLYLVPQETPGWPGVVPEGGGRGRDLEPEQLMQGLHRVSCNVSGYLLLDPKRSPLQPLVRFPPGSYRHDEMDGKDLPLPASAIFAAGGQWSQTAAGAPAATVLALADHSVFINQMLMEPGTDNWELARRAAVCLRGSPSRRWCRLYVNGSRVSSREVLQALLSAPVPPVPPVLPPPPSGLPDFWAVQKTLTELGNRAVQTAQERDLPNTILLGSPEFPLQRQERWAALLKLAAILMLAGALGLVWRGVRQSRTPESLPVRIGRGSSQPSRRGWFQRQLPGRPEAAWSEVMRRVLRDFFIQAGAGDPTSNPAPPIVVVSQLPQAEKWQRQLQMLWRFARAPTLHLTWQQWSQWERVLEELMQAQRGGCGV